ITYRFEAMPRVLEVAIPCAYNDQLFERDQNNSQAQQQESEKVHISTHVQDKSEQTETQEHAEAEVSLAQSEHAKEKHEKKSKQDTQESQEVAANVTNGRSVTVLGKTPNPEKQGEYIIAGSTVKQATGEQRPVAVVVNEETQVYNHEGVRTSVEMMRDVQEGMTVLVEGKKSKRGVIVAKKLVI
ncbi:MAG TPA: hypothetical protein DHW02_20240, partial [Ktedonobacter sp.]|nr:hypothetical protein [Ktedonobacter sp.]